jgi:hypothetical protein
MDAAFRAHIPPFRPTGNPIASPGVTALIYRNTIELGLSAEQIHAPIPG